MKTPSVLLLSILVGLAACNNESADAPTGQVVATVDGEEITTADLQSELGGAPTDANRKAAEQAALQSIVSRRLLADAARDRDLDKSPFAAIVSQRAEDIGLIELLQRDLMKTTPNVSQEEAQTFVNEHPATFANRRFYVVDQLIARGASPQIIQQMEPLTTIEQIEGLLARNNIPFTKAVGVLDTLVINPEAAEKLASLPSGEVFVAPDGAVTRVNRVRDVQLVPLTGDDAVRVAQDMLRNQRGRELLGRQFQEIIANGMKDVQYNAAFKPPAAPKAAPAAPAT